MFDYKTFISANLIIALMGFFGEGIKFLKWYIAIRKRVTTNCMQSLIKNYKDIASVEKSDRMDHHKDFDLSLKERAIVSILFFCHRFCQLMVAAQIMISFHFDILFAACLGTASGNFIFSGLVADQVLINRIKREIKMKMVLNNKISTHNEQVVAYCNSGQKSLIKHYKEDMSLQKIQVELETLRSITEPEDENEWSLGRKILNDFKNWQSETRYVRKKPSVHIKKPK